METLTWPAFVLVVGLALAAGRVGVGPISVGIKKTTKVIVHPITHPKHDMKKVGHFLKGGK